MELNALLNELQKEIGGTTKTASAAPTEKLAQAPVAAPANRNAVDDLLKVAAELSGAEKEAELAQASVLGTAMADAAIARFSAYQGATSKTASAGGYTEADMEKAAQYGYQMAIDALRKQAEEECDEECKEEAKEEGESEEEEAKEEEKEEAKKEAAYFARGSQKLAAAAEVLGPDALVKFAAHEGLSPVLEKMAADYEAGYKQAQEEISTRSQEEFLKGASETEILLDVLRKG